MKQASSRLNGARLVFISHASEDTEQAQRLAAQLASCGLRVWIDSQQLDRSDHDRLVSERVWEGLGAATDLVLIHSSASSRKQWVQHEALIGSERWLSTGAPNLWVVTLDQAPDIPDIPYLESFRWSTQCGAKLAARIEATLEHKELASGGSQELFLDLRNRYVMGGLTAVRAINTFDQIAPQIRLLIDQAAAVWFAGDNSRVVLSSLRILSKFLDLRMDQAWLCEVLSAAAKIESAERQILMNNLGTALIYSGKAAEARPYLISVSDHWRRSGDWLGVAMARGNLAMLELERRDLNAAAKWLKSGFVSLEVALREGALDEPSQRSEYLTTLSNLHSHRGRILGRRRRWRDARQALGESLAIAVSNEDRRAIGAALGRSAWLDIRQGNVGSITSVALDRYLLISLSSANPRGTAYARSWRGQLAILLGKHEQAADEFRAEISLRESLGNPVRLFRAYCWASLSYKKAGDTRNAAKFRRSAKSLSSRVSVIESRHDKLLLDCLDLTHLPSLHANPDADHLLRQVMQT